MAGFNLLITAQSDTDVAVIFDRFYSNNIMARDGSFGEWLKRNIACVKWEIDDGDDTAGTGYCQYIAYPDPDNMNNYLLAGWRS